MKSYTLVAFAALALLATVSTKNIESKTADKDFLIKQKFILEILQHVYQDDVLVTKYDSSYYEYKPWEHVADYHKHELLEPFFELWQHKPMHDDEVFSIMYERHVEYAVGLTRLFYFAKDWTTFAHAVFWARLNVNKQLFVYALTVAGLHRADMQGIVYPAIYEIQPWHFFDVETIETAERYRMHNFHNVKKLDNIYNVAIKSNYSNVYSNMHRDHELAYFLEDVGLNAFYYYYNLDYPFWTKGVEGMELNKDRRGEFWIYTHWQLLARYYLERLSHDLGDIEEFDMYESIPNGYYSGLRYYSGVNFPNRENGYSFYHNYNLEYIRLVNLVSQRIMDYIHDHHKDDIEAVNKLGNILQGNVDSIDRVRYSSLSNYYKQIVNDGNDYGKYEETLPNTFMHYETALRDPLNFQIIKDIIHFYWHLVEVFPEYTVKDYNFEGVKINKVQMPDHLTTYFEYFDSDISNAVNVEIPAEDSADPLVNFGRNSQHDGQSFVVKARQYRLNHKPFQFQLDVTSDKAQKAIVKVYIGPGQEEDRYHFIESNYMNFFELEHFVVNLVEGVNVITRNSDDFSWWVEDRTPYLELYKKVMDATNSDYKFGLNQKEAHCGVPQRLMLPIGKKGGMPYQMFFMVYPYHEPAIKQHTGYDPIISCGIGSGARWVDSLPFGFPFNRPVKHGYYFDVDNFHFEPVVIYHKEEAANVV
ncbi:PREDICTED: larval serum protein 2 [Bactrocera latifrons]|uniref:Larval serum protein 2 n=1 Tax=Bactrocera latifrons TaxID=174628 RepID=A0A0K8W959_BACLA|nr:PREDICTED: larval serum protein 2 [Bactrocera latifrons]